MKIKIINKNYGCFTVKALCECEKCVFTRGFSWEEDKIGISDKDKILLRLYNDMSEKEIYFCQKCGEELHISAE